MTAPCYNLSWIAAHSGIAVTAPCRNLTLIAAHSVSVVTAPCRDLSLFAAHSVVTVTAPCRDLSLFAAHSVVAVTAPCYNLSFTPWPTHAKPLLNMLLLLFSFKSLQPLALVRSSDASSLYPLVFRVGQNPIYTVYTRYCLAGKSPNIRSYAVYKYSSGQPYLYHIPCSKK